MTDKTKNGNLIKQLARKYGFAHVGLSKIRKLDEHEDFLKKWLDRGFQGEMNYLTKHFEKRLDPSALVPGAKSVISFAYNYYSNIEPGHHDSYKISRYAYGKDYHHVIKNKIQNLLKEYESQRDVVQGRIFVDSAPILERAWARESGIGWVGKNTLLIHPKMGSYFFLAELVSDIDIISDSPISDYCGTCRKCIDACPTEAIHDEGYMMDGSKCISYATIEIKANRPIPEGFKGKMNNWIFGCDICQEVCPWNRFSEEHEEPDFLASSNFNEWTKVEWELMDNDLFIKSFPKSPLKRAKFEGIQRNIRFINE